MRFFIAIVCYSNRANKFQIVQCEHFGVWMVFGCVCVGCCRCAENAGTNVTNSMCFSWLHWQLLWHIEHIRQSFCNLVVAAETSENGNCLNKIVNYFHHHSENSKIYLEFQWFEPSTIPLWKCFLEIQCDFLWKKLKSKPNSMRIVLLFVETNAVLTAQLWLCFTKYKNQNEIQIELHIV